MLALFILTILVPGDPASILLGPEASPEFAALYIAEMGLDQPIPVRLAHFFFNVAKGDLGTDVLSGRPIAAIILNVLPYTISLALSAMLVAILIGVPVGIYAATREGTLQDLALATVSLACLAVPSFVVGLVLLLVFSVWLDWLPILGMGRDESWLDHLRRMILPVVALSLGWIGLIARLVRASMIDVLREPYIDTARAYGLAPSQITYKYALKNAVTPLVAVLGLGIGRLLGGAVLVEIVFSRPGLGQLVLHAIEVRNYPVLQATVLVVVVMFVGANLIVDLLHSIFNPRVRHL